MKRAAVITATIGAAAGLFAAFLVWRNDTIQRSPDPAQLRAVRDLIAEFESDKKTRQRDNEDRMLRAVADADGVAVVKFVTHGVLRASRTLLEGDLIERCVARRGPERVVDGDEFATNSVVPWIEGLTLTFGPGLHVLDAARFDSGDEPFPSDVSIRGAGKDVTLIRLHDLSMTSDVKRLTFQDLSIDVENSFLFDLTRATLVVDLERVRILRLDWCSTLFSTTGAIVFARDCEFLGGYGRLPGSGKLFRGSPILARFVDCRFDLLDLALTTAARNGHVLFEGCTFTRMRERTDAAPNVTFDRCSFEPMSEANAPHARLEPKPLTDLFPFLAR